MARPIGNFFSYQPALKIAVHIKAGYLAPLTPGSNNLTANIKKVNPQGMFANFTECTFRKIHSLSTGEAHSRVEASITSPTSPPYVTKQLTALFHTQPLFSSLGCQTVAPTINCVF